jgi:glycerol-3-phosphate acyltransferase PlsY
MATSAVAVTAGHNWSLFLRFTGGRGLGTAFGAMIFLDPLALVAVAGPGIPMMALAKARRLPVLAEITLVCALLIPVGAVWLGSSSVVVLGEAVLVGVLLAKRLLSNAGVPRAAGPLHKVLLYRLLFDRDVASYEEWVYRRPAEREQISS